MNLDFPFVKWEVTGFVELFIYICAPLKSSDSVTGAQVCQTHTFERED